MNPVTIEMISACRDNPPEALRLYHLLIEYYRSNPVPYPAYTEVHHVVPKCMGGDNSPSNLIPLDALTHFDCHLLLVYAHANAPPHIVSQLQGGVRILLGRGAPSFEVIASSSEEMRKRYEEVRHLCALQFNLIRQTLLDMIKNNKKRPHWRSELAMYLNMYTCTSHNSYRPGFKEELVAAGGGQWFNDTRFIDDCNKLLEIAGRNDPRPAITTRLGHRLARYVSPKSKDYQPEFRAKLLEIARKDWFENKRGGRKPKSPPDLRPNS